MASKRRKVSRRDEPETYLLRLGSHEISYRYQAVAEGNSVYEWNLKDYPRFTTPELIGVRVGLLRSRDSSTPYRAPIPTSTGFRAPSTS